MRVNALIIYNTRMRKPLEVAQPPITLTQDSDITPLDKNGFLGCSLSFIVLALSYTYY